MWRPQNTVAIDDERAKLLKLIETLNENDDVQNVYANFEISDALVQQACARPPGICSSPACRDLMYEYPFAS